MLLRRLSYCPTTGIVAWRDGQRAGLEAGTRGANYRQITIAGVTYCTHIVAWLLMTGEFPPSGYEVDHINRNQMDNRWLNFRLATHSQNKMNQVSRKGGAPVRGAYWDRDREKWCVRIVKGGRQYYVGRFDSLEGAREARRSAEIGYFGAFAPILGVA